MRIFLSYHTPDKILAEELRNVLNERGFEVFFAPANLRAGQFWSKVLYQEIENAEACIFLIGIHGVGKWQEQEYLTAHEKTIDNSSFSLIPVTLRKELPRLPFIQNIHSIFTDNPLDRSSLSKIINGLKRRNEHVDQHKAWKDINPYRGLEALRSVDAQFFFGREEETTKVIREIATRQNQIIMLVGNSGVGKSSLVNAGVIAHLRGYSKRHELPIQLKESRSWAYLEFRPGDDPIQALTTSFVQLWYSDKTDPEFSERCIGWGKRLKNEGNLHELINISDQRFSDLNVTPPSRYVLVIDQYEELYIRNSPNAIYKFSKLITDALNDSRIIVLSSMRADYYGQLQNNNLWFPVTHKIDVAPLQGQRLKKAITMPAELLGATFEAPVLIDELVEAAYGQSGALPLLADHMTDLWVAMQQDDKNDGVIRIINKGDIIEIGSALVKRAENFLAAHPADATVIKRLFTLKLTLVPRQGKPVRKTALKKDCNEEWPLIEKLASEQRMLTISQAEDGTIRAEIAHEILLERWERLHRWIEDERGFLSWKGDISHYRRIWESSGHKKNALLMGLNLDKASAWLSTRFEDIDTEDANFIKNSIYIQKEKEIKSKRRAKIAISLASITSLIFAALLILVVRQYNFSEKSRI